MLSLHEEWTAPDRLARRRSVGASLRRSLLVHRLLCTVVLLARFCDLVLGIAYRRGPAGQKSRKSRRAEGAVPVLWDPWGEGAGNPCGRNGEGTTGCR
jgi:hypothetical protein